MPSRGATPYWQHVFCQVIVVSATLAVCLGSSGADNEVTSETLPDQGYLVGQHHGINVHVFPLELGTWFNDTYQRADGDIFGLNDQEITRLDSNFRTEYRVPYGWPHLSEKRTLWYSPYFVVGSEDIYVFGKYYLRKHWFGQYYRQEEYVHAFSLHDPAQKVSVDLCRPRHVGATVGYCGQYYNFTKADFFGEGTERVVVNELGTTSGSGRLGGSLIHIMDIGGLVRGGAETQSTQHIQTLKADPIDYSWPLTRNIEGTNREEVLFVSFPAGWSIRRFEFGPYVSGKVRLTRLFGDTVAGRVKIEYLKTIGLKHKIWHVIESDRYGGLVLARTYRNGRRLEVRDMDGRVLNRWRLGRRSLGVGRLLGWHEFPVPGCANVQREDYGDKCFRTIAVLTQDWFSCDFPVVGRTFPCPTRILELHDSGRSDEIYSVAPDGHGYTTNPGVITTRNFMELDDGRVAFSVKGAIYVISVAEDRLD